MAADVVEECFDPLGAVSVGVLRCHMIIHRESIDAGAGKVVDHAVGRKTHAEGPPAKLVLRDSRSSESATPAIATNPQIR